MTRKITLLLFSLLIALNILFLSWHLFQNDINLSSDKARDFLLLKELDEKKIVLIGPRASMPGLFHGPLWTYLNYPAFLLGDGNPIVVGWFWIFLIVCFLIVSFYVAKHLFNELCAFLFVLITSLYLVYHSSALFHPYGAMFVLPLCFFFFVRYFQTAHIRHLLANIFLLGILIQFELAVGIFFFIPSAFAIIFTIFKNKKTKHLLSFLVLIIPLGTFILFYSKHISLITDSLFHQLKGDTNHSYLYFIGERIQIMTTGIEFLRYGPSNGSFYVFLLFTFFLFLQIKNKQHRVAYLAFIYLFIGYFTVSLVNKYNMLYFYVFPLFPFIFLIFSSFVTSKFKHIFLILFFLIYVTNLSGVIRYLESPASIGSPEDSWKSLYAVAQEAYKGQEKEFGYFIYSPDVVGYGPKYAMEFVKKEHGKLAYAFEKKPVTYLVIAPPPRDNPFMLDEWWRKNQLNIKSEPVSVTKFANGYKVEKYLLSVAEQKILFDPNINPGIHFR